MEEYPESSGRVLGEACYCSAHVGVVQFRSSSSPVFNLLRSLRPTTLSDEAASTPLQTLTIYPNCRFTAFTADRIPKITLSH